MNTNIDGNRKVMFALTAIKVSWSFIVINYLTNNHWKGIGRRFANIVCKKADVDLNKRAGELTEEEVWKESVCRNNKWFCYNFRLRSWLPSLVILVNTKFQIGFWTDKRISKMENIHKWHQTIWIQNFVRILNDWRRSELIVDYVIIGGK